MSTADNSKELCPVCGADGDYCDLPSEAVGECFEDMIERGIDALPEVIYRDWKRNFLRNDIVVPILRAALKSAE